MSTHYYPIIGLEIHAELKTATKMFCACRNDPDEERPNVNICPICMGHPGTLPVVNREALRQLVRMGIAVSGTIADFTEFDRKNYFYPDIPKGYQISQYKYPIVSGGALAGVALTRIHVEEDTASSSHPEDRSGAEAHSLVNFNRAGVPLMELVTEPVIADAETAVRFAKELQLLLRYLGAGDANMEKGEMRVEANISVSADPKKFGTKVEVKNLNSFRAVERSIRSEIERHTALLEAGGVVKQETRGFDESTGTTYSQRTKEDSHDYRYFPDPDIPKFYFSEIPEFSVAALTKTLPELPWEKRNRYVQSYKLKIEDADVFVSDATLAAFFEGAVAAGDGKENTVRLIANYITSDLLGMMRADKRELIEIGVSGDHRFLKINPKDFAELIQMNLKGKLSSRGVKDTLKVMFEEGGHPEVIAKERGLIQESDSAHLAEIVRKIIAENENVVSEYRAGKAPALQFLLGQCMRATKGSGNPGVLKELLVSLLAENK